jgi:hypothetical protein
MAYLYRHIRLDKNEPFYIGISNVDDEYRRAYRKTYRNKHWTNIVKGTRYEVEILIDDLTIEILEIINDITFCEFFIIDSRAGSGGWSVCHMKP